LLLPYLVEHPPVHLVVTALAGLKASPQRDADRSPMRAAQLGPGFAAVDVHAGLGKSVLDFAALKASYG
jgi:hypothetical protein